MRSTSGGVVMLKASTHAILMYSRVLVREINGSWSLGVPEPVWRKPHSVQTCISVSFYVREIQLRIRTWYDHDLQVSEREVPL
jgi:hypothetical protein